MTEQDTKRMLKKAINELITFTKAFKSTVGYQKYEPNVFECLNKRYIEAGKIIDEYNKKSKSKKNKL